jgi:hypothetical protein
MITVSNTPCADYDEADVAAAWDTALAHPLVSARPAVNGASLAGRHPQRAGLGLEDVA